jgi:anti-anti-sigma regulatory factor
MASKSIRIVDDCMTGEENDVPIGCKRRGDSIVVFCGRLLDISAARELHASLRQSLESGLAIEIDASVVERIDASILQLFYAFVRDARAADKNVVWHQPAQALFSAAQLLQLQDSLALPQNELAALR